MKHSVSYLFRQFCFILLFFFWGRVIFLLYNFSIFCDYGVIETLKCFPYSVSLDISAACYLTVFPLLIVAIHNIFPYRFFNAFSSGYFYFLILLLSCIYSSELLIYDEWHSKLQYKAIMHLVEPSEVFESATGTHIWKFFLFFFILFPFGIIAYRKFVYANRVNFAGWISFLKNSGNAFCLLITIVPLFFLGIRGGIKPVPINQSSAYYSKHNILNDAAVNSAWNLIHSIIENSKNLERNPYDYYDSDSSKKIVENLYETENDTTIQFLDVEKPNVILFILESFSADLIGAMGGDKGITPNLDKLIREGLLFDSLYATGTTSDMGMPSVLSAFPGQPITSIITQPGKYQNLPCINTEFKNHGYHTSYYFGGQLSYGNIKSYVYYNGFDQIYEEADFDNPDFIHGKLGIHDEFMMRNHLENMNKQQTPFFSVLFTLSTHPPYDIPGKKPLKWAGEFNPLVNAALYSDKAIGEYIANAKKQKWFDNTLFVFVADHSYNSPKNWPYDSPNHFRIPLLFYGNVLKKEFRGKKIEKIFSQTDLISTLFYQLHFDASKFFWSKNMMNPYSKEFAYYCYYDGFGWVKPDGHFTFENRFKKFSQENYRDSLNKEQIIREGKSYMQTLFQTYLDY